MPAWQKPDYTTNGISCTAWYGRLLKIIIWYTNITNCQYVSGEVVFAFRATNCSDEHTTYAVIRRRGTETDMNMSSYHFSNSRYEIELLLWKKSSYIPIQPRLPLYWTNPKQFWKWAHWLRYLNCAMFWVPLDFIHRNRPTSLTQRNHPPTHIGYLCVIGTINPVPGKQS